MLDGREDLGDWEQYGARIYHEVDYEELYAMAAHGGQRRRHVQLYNEFDNCCFSGIKGRESERRFRAACTERDGVSFIVVEGWEDHYNLPQAVVLQQLAAATPP
jgi:hypothetical protein